MIAYEARKLFLLNGAVWVLAGLMAVQFVTYLNFNAYIAPQERLYMQYSEKLAGTANQEKDDFIAEEAARFTDLHAQIEEYSRAFSDGEMQQEAYEALCSGIAHQLEGEETFFRARNQYDQMKILGYDYVCQTGYERLLGTEGRQDLVVLFIKLIISLVLGLSSIHSIESETSMALLLNSVPGQRNSTKMKSILASMYAVIAAIITFAPHILSIINGYGLPGLLSHGNSVQLLKMGTNTVLSELCVYAATIIVIAVFAAHVIALISKKMGNTTSTIVMSSVMLLPLFCILVV